MLCSVFNSHNTLLTEVSIKLMSYYSLLKIYGKTDREMKGNHMNLVKRMKGIKNVKWLDDLDEEHDDVMKIYCSLDPITFESNEQSSSPPADVSPEATDEGGAANRTLTLSSGPITPPTDLPEEPSTPTRPVSVPIPAPVTTKPSCPVTVKTKAARAPLVTSSNMNKNRPVVKTPIRTMKTGLNKENIPNSIVSKMTEVKNKPRFVPGVLKTPRDNKVTSNNIYSRKTPAVISDPTLVNRLKSINDRLY
ncbi:flocculation protein FLO11 isoform X2 [Diaphorina citri]|uniref:Flocculation protein FLO11 isoform X2 n=1 Tax=Diaphorina citri TaxID=121845 RepID=A0A1S3DLR8_DIACI|nr:flocculation protein FLO11 isoform X2 [Diaphorina citri]